MIAVCRICRFGTIMLKHKMIRPLNLLLPQLALINFRQEVQLLADRLAHVGFGCLAQSRGLCHDWLHLPAHRAQFGEPFQVLGGRRKQEFVLGAVWAAQSQTVEPENALEMSLSRKRPCRFFEKVE